MSSKKVLIEPGLKIKTEPGTSDSERLSSFKLPRDLTLGGSAHKAKRTFQPNLNIVRNKNKTDQQTSSTTNQTTRGGGRGNRGRNNDNRGRGRGRGREFIQSQGVFSEGIAETKRHSSWSSRSGGGGSKDDSANSIEKPKINCKQEIKVDKAEEDRKLEDIFAKNEHYGEFEPDYEFAPITLPCRGDSKGQLKIRIKTEKEFDVELKNEDGTKKESSESMILKNLTKIKTENILPVDTLSELLESQTQKFIFFQFPDSLPAFGKTPEPQPTTSMKDKKNTIEETPDNCRCTLNDLDEGLVGKIIIYKSGRAKLFLGDTQFNIELGMQRTFLQDVVSISTNDEKNDGSMINLGQIEGGVVLTPDWNYLLNNVT